MNNSARLTSSPLRRIFCISLLARLAHDTSIRMMYPFLPEIARGLGLPIDQVSALVSLRNGVGIIGPAFGVMSDRIGHRRSMSIGLVCISIGLGLIGGLSALLPAAIGFIIAGLGSVIYIPALQAYISERVPYEQRGRALGAIELTWAIAGMIGAPIAGGLIGSIGWRAPFIGLAIAAFGCALLTLLLAETPQSLRSKVGRFKLSSLRQHRNAIAFLLVWTLVFWAFENIQVGYGSWFETQFKLSATQRGTAQTLFGVFEIAASASSSLFLDRIGKKRGVAGGLIVALIGYGLLMTIGPINLTLALGSMGLAFLGFEFSVVSGISIMSEQIPRARATMLALGATGSGLGRMIGDLSGGALIANASFTTAALASAIMAALTLIIFVIGVQEKPFSNEMAASDVPS
ncbi:MAG TPA: MFS transporter [Anaerolineae bacterium]|nr:MFS transporter [Anaerolineae bacterium]